jgi:hypothetical protein
VEAADTMRDAGFIERTAFPRSAWALFSLHHAHTLLMRGPAQPQSRIASVRALRAEPLATMQPRA